jgi:hypothetical protein
MRPITVNDTLAAALPTGPAVVRGFTAGVTTQLAAGPLTHDQRQLLFARAARLGIGRFEANLIIAIADRQAGNGPTMRIIDEAPAPPDPPALPRGLTWATVAAVQSLIFGTAWWAFL